MNVFLIVILFILTLPSHSAATNNASDFISSENSQLYLEKSHLIATKEYLGSLRPSSLGEAGWTSLIQRAKAPSGNAQKYVPVTGKGYFEYEIYNHNSGSITCIVTRRVCMNRGDMMNSCINSELTFLIEKKGRVRDHGSYVHNTYTYKRIDDEPTMASIQISGCNASGQNAVDYGRYHVHG